MRKDEIKFRDACDFLVPFGKYRGRKLADVGRTDDGLRYLVWMVNLDDLRDETRAHIAAYLKEPRVAKMVDNAIENEPRRR
jgi:hypothetical protein